MTSRAIDLFRCLECGSTLLAGDGAEPEGVRLVCRSCAAQYPVRDGVAVFLPADLNGDVGQVQSSYSAKWARVPDIYDDDSFSTRANHDWYLDRYHWPSEEALADFLREKRLILDAGCGLGRDVRWYARLNDDATVIGADLSEAAFLAAEKSRGYANASIIQADLNRLPFEPESFDFVACDQVLPCVADPPAAVARLWSLVRTGGHLAIYVYRKKAPIREFTDDYLRERITTMDFARAWEACRPLTELGKALSDLNVEFELPSDIPELGMRAGRYDLQRFLYYNVLKMFWNDGMTFDENNLVNVDWFHPAFTYRHTPEEVEGWLRELGMNVLVFDTDDPSGLSVLAQKG